MHLLLLHCDQACWVLLDHMVLVCGSMAPRPHQPCARALRLQLLSDCTCMLLTDMLCCALVVPPTFRFVAPVSVSTAAERIGVFAEPELEFRYLGPHDSFLIIASDGVFEFISSQRVVDMVSREGGKGGGVATGGVHQCILAVCLCVCGGGGGGGRG